jgi:hypothetical protein
MGGIPLVPTTIAAAAAEEKNRRIQTREIQTLGNFASFVVR